MPVLAQDGFVLKGKVFTGLLQYNLPPSTTDFHSETAYLDIEYVYDRFQEKDQQIPTFLMIEKQLNGFQQVGELHKELKKNLNLIHKISFIKAQ